MSNTFYDINTVFSEDHIVSCVQRPHESLAIVQQQQTKQMGVVALQNEDLSQLQLSAEMKRCAWLPPLWVENLGDKQFRATHGLRFAYVVGEMANGVATAEMVIAAARAGLFGFFGAAGLMPDVIEKNIRTIRSALGEEAVNWGSNLIYMPNEPDLEARVVELYLNLQVTRVSASAYMSLSPHIVRYATRGLSVNEKGEIIRQNYVLAKLSRPEVAQQFMSPPPQTMLDQLVAEGKISANEAQLASRIPVAHAITVEADSGGHTDNRPLMGLFSTIQTLAVELTEKYHYQQPIFVGAAGGLGTPSSIAAAYALGADYVLTGSINAAAIESGFSLEAKKMLAQAGIVDVMMAPAADMFELGVKLQILKRGTLFGFRAAKLYELYRTYESLDAIPEIEKTKLEQQLFRDKLENIWQATQQFFMQRDPRQISQAEQDAKHKMALVFRWYLGQSTRWAMAGESSRRADYQIWCGPAMGAFNNWVAGSFLEDLTQRSVVQIGLNLLDGAAVITRANQLRHFGVIVPQKAFTYIPQLKAAKDVNERKFTYASS